MPGSNSQPLDLQLDMLPTGLHGPFCFFCCLQILKDIILFLTLTLLNPGISLENLEDLDQLVWMKPSDQDLTVFHAVSEFNLLTLSFMNIDMLGSTHYE